MKRALLVSAGTIAGVAGVLALNPAGPDVAITASGSSGSTTNSSSTSTSTSNTSSNTNTATTSDTATPAATSGSSSGKQTVTGDSVMTRYGAIQLEVTVENGKITEINELAMPQNDGRSMMISQQAGPMLRKQALAANSANINGVSGATFTTMGYQQSLQSALDQLGM